MKGGSSEVRFSMTPTVPRKLEVPRAKWQMEAEVISMAGNVSYPIMNQVSSARITSPQ